MRIELDEEHRLIRQTVRDFCENEIAPVADELNRNGEYPESIVEAAADIGIAVPWIPERYGGAGMDVLGDSIVKEEVCRSDPAVGYSIVAQGNGGRMILEAGTEAQRETYLRGLADGMTGAIAISEPDAGSATRYMRTRAEPDGDELVLSGEKMWITNAPEADFMVVMARTAADSTPGDRDGISAIIVDLPCDGVTIDKIDMMGLDAGRTGQVVFSDARVPRENVIGAEGEGYPLLLSWFNSSRNYVGPMAVGIAQGALDEAVGYARERETFGKPIGEYQAIRHKLADMKVETAASRLLCYQSAYLQDVGDGASPLHASMAKLKASEVAESVASDAVQIHGAYGYSKEFAVERYYRAAKVMQIIEGTSEIQRNIIADQIV